MPRGSAAPLSAYELQRKDNIAQNDAALFAAGIHPTRRVLVLEYIDGCKITEPEALGERPQRPPQLRGHGLRARHRGPRNSALRSRVLRRPRNLSTHGRPVSWSNLPAAALIARPRKNL